MIKDYTAHILRAHQSVLKELNEAESALDIAKASRDRQGQAEAQRAIDEQRRVLAEKLPSVAFHYLGTTDLADADGLRSAWQQQVLGQPNTSWKNLHDVWRLSDLTARFESPQIALSDLPPLSFWLSFRFTLRKPYISRDEDAFYIIDNPVRKDKVLCLPFTAPSTCKGALRSAARYVVGDPPTPEAKPDNQIIERLFGTDKRRETKDLRLGRLWCFPTFFRNVGLEIINPHLRDTGAGDKPIPFETATGSGYFNLLYVPFDLSSTAFNEVAEDIEAVAKAVPAMFLTYGLAAKKTSGFGVAQKQVSQFNWQVHHWVEKPVEQGPEHETLEQDIADFVSRFGISSFPHWNNTELEQSGWGRKRISEYKRLRSKHPDWDESEHRWQEAVPKVPRYELLQIEESSLDLSTLPDVAHERLARVLREEAE